MTILQCVILAQEVRNAYVRVPYTKSVRAILQKTVFR